MEQGKAPNRLDAALNRLEEVVKSRIQQPMRLLRVEIEWLRTHGGFNEEVVADEIDNIASRDRAESRRYFSVGEEITALTNRLHVGAP